MLFDDEMALGSDEETQTRDADGSQDEFDDANGDAEGGHVEDDDEYMNESEDGDEDEDEDEDGYDGEYEEDEDGEDFPSDEVRVLCTSRRQTVGSRFMLGCPSRRA